MADHHHRGCHGHPDEAALEEGKSSGLLLRKMTRQERELNLQAIQKQGKLWKKATNGLLGFQLRYFKVIANGRYLVYYEKAQMISNEAE